MKTNDSNDKEARKIELPRIFSSIDTQSAIVATLVISLGTLILKYFIDLCEFVYWRSYFNRFYIPLEYLGEAIIQTTEMKYTFILYTPLIVFLWWGLNTLSNVINSKIPSRVKKQEKKARLMAGKKRCVLALNIIHAFGIYVCLFWVIGIVADFFMDTYGYYYHVGMIIFAEICLYIFSRVCKKIFGVKYVFSKKIYFYIRFIGLVISFYLVLGFVFFLGSFSNAGSNIGTQSVRLVNESSCSFDDIKEGERLDVKMVLLETEEYYYVTDAKLNRENGNLKLLILNLDNYRFIDKVECPTTTRYINLKFWSALYDENVHELHFYVYLFSVFIFLFIIGGLLSVPKRKNREEKDEIVN